MEGHKKAFRVISKVAYNAGVTYKELSELLSRLLVTGGMDMTLVMASDHGIQWEENTYYVVDVAFTKTNPMHRKIFFSGFLSADKKPQGYNGFARFGRSDEALDYQDIHSIKIVRKINVNT